MPVSPAATLIFFAVALIFFGAIVFIDDLIQARARKRRIARRRRYQRMDAYHALYTIDRTRLSAHNVVPLDPWSRKVGA
jgi:hypothetical protein